MRWLTRTMPVIIAGLAVALSGCSTTKVTTDWDRTVDFGRFGTYQVVKPNRQPPNPLMLKRVQDAVRRELDARGFEEVRSGADLQVIIHGHGGVERRVDVGGYGYGYRWHGWGAGTVRVTDIPKGTVIVDLVDAATHELEWRGMVTDTVRDDPERNWAVLDRGIARMFADFPDRS